MLQNMREFSKSWVMRGFFAILVFAFVFLWGVSDVFQPGRLSKQNVATVGNITIDTHDFMKEVAIKSKQIQNRSGTAPEPNLIQQQVLQGMLYNALLDQEADHLGLAISDQQVIEFVKSTKSFQNENGQFSKQLFEAIAHSEGFTVKEFEETLRKSLRRNQLLQLVTTGVSLPKAYLTPLLKWQYEKRNIDWATLRPSSLKDIPAPKPEEMKAYYEGHKDTFTQAEERDMTIAFVSEASLRSKVKLSDEEIQAGFASRKDNTKSALPSKTETEKIMTELKAEKAAEEYNKLVTALEDSLSGGNTVEELAKKYELKLVKVEGLRRDGSSRNKTDLASDALIEAIEQGFRMEVGDDAYLSQLGNGDYMLARLDKIHNSKLRPYEDVSNEISTLLNDEARHKAAKEMAIKLAEKINAGTSLAQIAKDNKLDLNTGVVLARVETEDKKISRALRSIAFQTELNKANIAPSENGSLAILVPRKIIEPKSEDIKDDEIKAFASALEENISSDLLQQFMASLESRYKVQINETVLKSLQK